MTWLNTTSRSICDCDDCRDGRPVCKSGQRAIVERAIKVALEAVLEDCDDVATGEAAHYEGAEMVRRLVAQRIGAKTGRRKR